VLAGLAAAVPRLRLGTLVTGNTYRNPGVLAKQVSQVDNISGGRVILGLGAGWQDNEHRAFGIPFYTVPERLRRLEESVQVVRSLFDNERTTFEGRYYSFEEAPLSPKPVQSHLPMLIGGGGEKVTMRIAARFADEWNVWGTPETLAKKGQVLEQHCETAGRDPSTIKRSAQVLIVMSEDNAEVERVRAGARFPVLGGGAGEIREVIGQYQKAKLDEFILPVFTGVGGASERRELCDRFMEEVAAEFR
jgi:F420-dependent oxidoreductase-like protein